MKMKQCTCSDRSPTWHAVFHPHKYLPLFLCPLRMHPSFFFCSWLGFQNDRRKPLDAVHRDCLVRRSNVELRVDGLGLLSAHNEVFVCYTLLDTDTLYCVVQHACCYKACNSEFSYVTEVTDAFTGKTDEWSCCGHGVADVQVSEGHTQGCFLLWSRRRPVSEILYIFSLRTLKFE
jgi:hypothetical protein